jgi:hypothetical protein
MMRAAHQIAANGPICHPFQGLAGRTMRYAHKPGRDGCRRYDLVARE